MNAEKLLAEALLSPEAVAALRALTAKIKETTP